MGVVVPVVEALVPMLAVVPAKAEVPVMPMLAVLVVAWNQRGR
jgi:hypothetical protein